MFCRLNLGVYCKFKPIKQLSQTAMAFAFGEVRVFFCDQLSFSPRSYILLGNSKAKCKSAVKEHYHVRGHIVAETLQDLEACNCKEGCPT